MSRDASEVVDPTLSRKASSERATARTVNRHKMCIRDRPSIAPKVGKRKAAITLKRKITEIDWAMSSSDRVWQS